MQDITQEEKEIKILKFCGWTEIEWRDLINPRIARENKQFCRDNEERLCMWKPNYFESLDAIHEAQKCLPEDAWPEYWDHLCYITYGDFFSFEKRFIHATAANHVEAFYRTISSAEENAENP